MGRFRNCLGAAIVAGATLGAPPVLAITGQVVDPEGHPIRNARACILVADRDGLCRDTDAHGYFQLIDTRLPKMRISADGYLPIVLAAVTQGAPIVLEREAVLRIHLEDAGGEAIPDGKVTLLFPSGRKIGPLPANQAGVRVRTLPAGEVLVRAEAEGYRAVEGQTVTLVSGREVEVHVALAADTEAATESDSP